MAIVGSKNPERYLLYSKDNSSNSNNNKSNEKMMESHRVSFKELDEKRSQTKEWSENEIK